MLSGSRLTKRGLHPTQEKQSAQAVLRFIRSIPGGSLFGADITIRKVVRPMLWDATRPTLYASTEPRITRPCRGLTAVRRSRCVHLRIVYTTTVIKQSHTERGSWLWPLPLGGGCETSQKRSPFAPLRRSLIIDILVKCPSFSNAKSSVSTGTTVHWDLTHVARSCGRGAEARGRPECA